MKKLLVAFTFLISSHVLCNTQNDSISRLVCRDLAGKVSTDAFSYRKKELFFSKFELNRLDVSELRSQLMAELQLHCLNDKSPTITELMNEQEKLCTSLCNETFKEKKLKLCLNVCEQGQKQLGFFKAGMNFNKGQ